MAFLSQQFHYNNGVGVVVSTDIGVDNVDNNVSELTVNLDSRVKTFVAFLIWKIKFLKTHCQKKMLNIFLLHLRGSS